jgi:hypothetical protein
MIDYLDTEIQTKFETFISGITDEGVFYKNIINYVIEFMKIIENTNYKSSDKKKIVILTIEKIIKKHISSDFEKETMLLFVDNILPGLIDKIISLDRGDIIINDVKKSICGCLGGLF